MDLLVLLSVFPAYLVGSYFVRHDPGPPEPKKALMKGIQFGVLAVVLALGIGLLIEQVIGGDFASRVQGLQAESGLPFIIDILIFAGMEEFVKFIPISIYLLKKDFFNEYTDGIIYFAIVGLTFGAIESFLYGFSFGDLGVFVVLSRLVLGLFFHAALTSIVGFFFASATLRRRGMWRAGAVLLAVTLAHTVYNYFAYTAVEDQINIVGAALIALATNILMFWLFYKASQKDFAEGYARPQTSPLPPVGGSV